ncbi:GGDEF domain-containing protein [Candidatus Omnitrophota bacterium]
MIHSIFILTTIAILFVLKSKISKNYSLNFNDLIGVEGKINELSLIEKQLNEENARREEDVLKIMNIYGVTKDVCEFLEEEKIFSIFKRGLSQFIEFQECNYVATIESQKNLEGSKVIPLTSESDSYGYLVIKGLKNEEKEVLDILVTQFVTNIKRARLYARVQELAIRDSLTRVFTRRYFLDRFEEELGRSKEFDLSLSSLMIDIDNFKSYNDKYGHLVGDVILKTVADVIKSNCREIDLIGRFGGEEFIVIMPMTSKDGALFAAERIRKSLESKTIKAFDESLKVTLSIGVASFAQDAQTSQELIDKADWALYRSKRTGKNRVSAFAKYEQ